MSKGQMTPSESALNDRVIAAMRYELTLLVEKLQAHKKAGCTEPTCPGQDVVDFYKKLREDSTMSPASHWLFVALHMLATGNIVDPFAQFEEALHGSAGR